MVILKISLFVFFFTLILFLIVELFGVGPSSEPELSARVARAAELINWRLVFGMAGGNAVIVGLVSALGFTPIGKILDSRDEEE